MNVLISKLGGLLPSCLPILDSEYYSLYQIRAHRAAHKNRSYHAHVRERLPLCVPAPPGSTAYTEYIVTPFYRSLAVTRIFVFCAHSLFIEFFLLFNFHVTLWQMFHLQRKILWERLVKKYIHIMYYALLYTYYSFVCILYIT